MFCIEALDAWHADSFDRARESLSFSRRTGGWEARTFLVLTDGTLMSGLAAEGDPLGSLAGTTLSDHAPVILHIEDPGQSGRSQSVRIPGQLIEDDGMRERVEEIWKGLNWNSEVMRL